MDSDRRMVLPATKGRCSPPAVTSEPGPTLPTVSKARLACATAARLVSPGYGCCYRCGMPWSFTEYHVTHYGNGHGCFPLCEACWSELTPEQRWPFYERLLHDWRAYRPVEGSQAEAILGAVMSGG